MRDALINRAESKGTLALKLAYLGVSIAYGILELLSEFILLVAYTKSMVSCRLYSVGEAINFPYICWSGAPWIAMSLIATLGLFYRKGMLNKSKDSYASLSALSYCVFWLCVFVLTRCWPLVSTTFGHSMTTIFVLMALAVVYHIAWSAVNIWLFICYFSDLRVKSES